MRDCICMSDSHKFEGGEKEHKEEEAMHHLIAASRCLFRLPALFRPYSSVLLSPSCPVVLRKSNPLILSQNAFFPSRFARNLCVRATDVNDAGSIDSPLMQSMEMKIRGHLNAESVSVKDAYGDGRHVSIEVVSAAFEGQSAVNRQRMVYKAIWEELQSTVHAVDHMTTRTPSEASSQRN